jgi:hypothetical protein
MLGANGADGLPSGATVLYFPDVQIPAWRASRAGVRASERGGNRVWRRAAAALAAGTALSALVAAAGAAQDERVPPGAANAAFVAECARVYDAAACRCAARAGVVPPPTQLADRSPDPALPPRSVFADPLRRDSAVRVIAACVNPHPVGD